MYPPQMTAHLGGKPHRERMAASAAAAPTGGTAPVSRGLQQQAAQARGQTAPQHALGARIQPSGQAHGRSTPASQNAGGGDMFCERCEVAVYPQFWTTHLQSASHLRRTQQARQQAEFAAATANKNGIEVSADVDFGVVELGASEAFTASFSLTQTNPAGRVLLLRTPFTSDFRGGGQGYVQFVPSEALPNQLISRAASPPSSSARAHGYSFVSDGRSPSRSGPRTPVASRIPSSFSSSTSPRRHAS